MPRLTLVEARGLLGEFDHRIGFPAEWDFVIVYGPNGVGKTKLLESIKALLSLETYALGRAPFTHLRLDFDDGHELRAIKPYVESSSREEEDIPDDEQDSKQLTITLRHAGERVAEVSLNGRTASRGGFLRWLERNTPWHQVGPDLWEDPSDGELVSVEVLQRRFAGQRGDIEKEEELGGIPEAIKNFCDSVHCHLIETQRLLIVPKNRASRMPGMRTAAMRATVSEYSEDLRRNLNRALAQNSRMTQTLDRSFPRRILERRPSPQIYDDLIRRRYTEQNSLRTRLAKIGLIGSEPDFPLPDQTLEPWQREVLSTYLDDTDQKLATFDAILSKVTLLEEIVNSRFLRKRISVNAEDGLTIHTHRGQRIGPADLSSGEQHELILIYDLLFNVPEGSLVMIDEPEISLHVVWQQRFLADLSRIAELSSLRFVVATHSPQIIHKSWDKTVELSLGGEDGE
jgi:ABC-type lipoprotein export system ATPase subunit